jgi:hypothetical protein
MMEAGETLTIMQSLPEKHHVPCRDQTTLLQTPLPLDLYTMPSARLPYRTRQGTPAMTLPFCTMTSRSARMLLSEQEKSTLLNKVARVLHRIEGQSSQIGLAYRNLRLVIESKERVIKIMTEHEFSRLHPLLVAINLVSERSARAA